MYLQQECEGGVQLLVSRPRHVCPVDESAASRTWEDWEWRSDKGGRGRGGTEKRGEGVEMMRACRVQWSGNLRQQQDETGPSRENKVGGSLVPLHIG